jgi:DNA-binding beta-propeller fold protein YncE
MFIVGDQGNDINEYILSSGFDVSTASYSQNFSVSAQETAPHGIAFNTDGTKMFIVGKTGDNVNEYALSTGFDVSTASYSQNFSIASQETDPTGIAFNADGTKMFIVGRYKRRSLRILPNPITRTRHRLIRL